MSNTYTIAGVVVDGNTAYECKKKPYIVQGMTIDWSIIEQGNNVLKGMVKPYGLFKDTEFCQRCSEIYSSVQSKLITHNESKVVGAARKRLKDRRYRKPSLVNAFILENKKKSEEEELSEVESKLMPGQSIIIGGKKYIQIVCCQKSLPCIHFVAVQIKIVKRHHIGLHAACGTLLRNFVGGGGFARGGRPRKHHDFAPVIARNARGNVV